MLNPLGFVPSIAASGSEWVGGSVPLVYARSFSLTAEVAYHASATKVVDCEIYYSPDGKNWDTSPIDEFELPLTAGSTVRQSYLAGVPEHGTVKVLLKNNDASCAATLGRVWFTISSWGDAPLPPRMTGA